MEMRRVRLISKLFEKQIQFNSKDVTGYGYNVFDKDCVVYNGKRFVLSLYHVYEPDFNRYLVLERVCNALNPRYKCGSASKYIDEVYVKKEQYTEQDIADMLFLEKELNNIWIGDFDLDAKVCSAVNSTVWNKFKDKL